MLSFAAKLLNNFFGDIMRPRWLKNSFIYLLIGVAVIAVFFSMIANPMNGTREVSITEVVDLVGRGDVD